MIPPPQPPSEATDIFSISDQVLAERLQFINEIGFGNWGSVWLCRPRPDPASPSSETSSAPIDTRIAVKLVHRSKTSTTAARVRSLWNEMKVVRALKHEPHPSIISFYSFIITPSYALITMAYHPRLVPVEVPETHAKEWFRSLLSGVEFLHRRGVVHNDIKPANILLSAENVPILVDFGFAERYNIESGKAFHSNLSYGTPEYLSPERARGLPHDTRKSDVWSLGITFFEILIGRTPFEYCEGEEFSTKEDLEKYWSRTLRGKWVGTWKMSKSCEKLLKRMVLPNADLRCTASDAMSDLYWLQSDAPMPSHRKMASMSHAPTLSLGLEKDVAKFLDIIPPWSPREKDKDKEKLKAEKVEKGKSKKYADKENAAASPAPVVSPPEAHKKVDRRVSLLHMRPGHGHERSQSQPKLLTPEACGVSQSRKNGGMPSLLATLSPVKHSPPPAPLISVVASSATNKENASPAPAANANTLKNIRSSRKPLGPRGPTPPNSPVLRAVQNHAPAKENSLAVLGEKDKNARRSRVFRDVTSASRNTKMDKENAGASMIPKRVEKEKARPAPTAHSNSVRDRMREWERERERIREMEALEERIREGEEEREKARCEREAEEARERERQQEREREREREGEREVELEREREKARRLEIELERQRELERTRAHALLTRDQERPGSRVQRTEVDRPRLSLGLLSSTTPTETAIGTPLSPLEEEPSENCILQDPLSRSGNESGISVLKQGFKLSTDKMIRLYKTSAAALGRSTLALNIPDDAEGDDQSGISLSEQTSWEDDKANSSLPVVRNAMRADELAMANNLDRMTIWIRNVERVVEDARQNFEASTNVGPLPPLPLAPISRHTSTSKGNRSMRVPRKILAANQIFVDEYESGIFDNSSSFARSTSYQVEQDSKADMNTTPNPLDCTIPTIPSEQNSMVLEKSSTILEKDRSPMMPEKILVVPETPTRRRRATVVTRSPEPAHRKVSLEIDTGSPSKRREKCRSQNDLLRPITPVSKLEFELEKLAMPARPQRLSAVVDRSMFIASATSTAPQEVINESPQGRSRSQDELTASPLLVQPYPARPQGSKSMDILDTPGRKHIEDVYDRFLMSTAGVKRVGKGYQSNMGPISNIPVRSATAIKRNQGFFHSTRRPLPPPVSSDDLRRASSVDEFGIVIHAEKQSAQDTQHGKNTVAIVRKAFKTVLGKPAAKTRVL